MSARIVVERLSSGFYRAQGSGPCEWAQWDPKAAIADGDFFPEASAIFRSALRGLSLGPACLACGYLEFEHDIDGEEKAPCEGFVDPGERP